MSRSEFIAEMSVMSQADIQLTIRALQTALDMDTDSIKSLIADGEAIAAKRGEEKPRVGKKRGRPAGTGRKGVIQQDTE